MYLFLHWNIHFCTGIHIFVLELNIFLYWNTHFCAGMNIYLCTGIHIFVLEPIFLYWNLYFCTGIYIFVLELIFLYWNLYFCTGIHIFVLELIFLYWNLYFCIALVGHRKIVVTVTYFSTGVHYLMLNTWVDKTERMSVKFKDSLFKATA